MVTRLADGVWWFDLQGVNAYLVEDDAGVTLVDTGMPWHANAIVKGITRAVGSMSAVDRVLVTHFDFDHVGGLDRLHALDATVYVGSADEPYLTGRDKPTWSNRKGAFQRVADVFRSAPDLDVEAVEDGDEVGPFVAYATPGHTPGHTAFIHEGLSAAFLGDLVRESGGTFERPPWFLNYDHEKTRESIVDFADRAPSFDIACPGHGTPFVSDGSDRLTTCAASLTDAPSVD